MDILTPDYRDMVECLQTEHVDFMLVGGYALAIHGIPRTTFDIDFWVMANPENAAALMRASGRPKDVADVARMQELQKGGRA